MPETYHMEEDLDHLDDEYFFEQFRKEQAQKDEARQLAQAYFDLP